MFCILEVYNVNSDFIELSLHQVFLSLYFTSFHFVALVQCLEAQNQPSSFSLVLGISGVTSSSGCSLRTKMKVDAFAVMDPVSRH